MNFPFLPVDPTKSFTLALEHPKTWFVLGVIIKLQANVTHFSAIEIFLLCVWGFSINTDFSHLSRQLQKNRFSAQNKNHEIQTCSASLMFFFQFILPVQQLLVVS